MNWTDIVGATGQNLLGTQLGPVNEDTCVRRIIGGDACILAGAGGPVVTVRLMTVTGIVTNASCIGLLTERYKPTRTDYRISNMRGAMDRPHKQQLVSRQDHSVTCYRCQWLHRTANITELDNPTVLGGQSTVGTSYLRNANGGATASGTGGTAPYTYLWSNNTNGPTISGVRGGTYTVTIGDAKNCTVDVIVIILLPAPTAHAGLLQQ
ncbi:MAG: hypothetical protein IPO87_07730 [Flavobacteriales bacterium]|nr:hypothetical protein [Flavobacteriales bacterium]